MPNLACSKSSCTVEASFRPVLILAFPGSAIGYRIRLEIQVCDEHRRELRKTFATPRGQMLVERALQGPQQGKS